MPAFRGGNKHPFSLSFDRRHERLGRKLDSCSKAEVNRKYRNNISITAKCQIFFPLVAWSATFPLTLARPIPWSVALYDVITLNKALLIRYKSCGVRNWRVTKGVEGTDGTGEGSA
jgi:hypothetical protein